MKESPACWCGNTALDPFSSHYDRCPSCETLVVKDMPGAEISVVQDDENDYYGREYWFSHQTEDLAYPDIVQRARADLPERCLHWLNTLLKYRLPPGRVLELGSAHGGFVAMLRWAGFDATGLELSPWVAQFSRETFQVPVLCGPLEQQSIEPGSLDVIALMDVLEHLPDPVGTMRKCLETLKPDGMLLIQTPRYEPKRTFEEMEASGDPFMAQLKAEQHLMLFSRNSITRLFTELGAPYISFEPAIFSHYDMFLAVGRVPLEPADTTQREAALTASPPARLIGAMLDLRAANEDIKQKLESTEADRVERLKVIHEQSARLGDVEGQLAGLQLKYKAAEEDRDSRLEVIHSQGARLGDLEGQLAAFRLQYEAAEEDRAARLEVIHSQGARLGDLEGQLAALRLQYEAAEEDRAARLEVIQGQGTHLGDLEGQLAALQLQYEAAEEDRAARLEVIHSQGARLGDLEGQLAALRFQYEAAEQDRAARLEVIQGQGARLGDLEGQLAAARDEHRAFMRSWRRFLPARMNSRHRG